jgi:methionyl-tRNA synthetase
VKYIVTTAIDYTNDVIHLGHAYQKVLADSYVRFLRQTKGPQNVSFVTGTDEFGQKVEKEAKSKGIETKTFVDEISKKDQNEQDSLNVSYNRFIRTTDLDHQKTAQDFFKKSYENGFIYEGEFQGKYCEGCEEYKTDKNLTDGKCPLHPTKEILITTEKNYFFKWSYFRDFLKKHFDENPQFVLPKSKFNEMYALIDEIEDIPVTRRKENLNWGIECPIDSGHVIYVWFDALINYYTFAKEDWNNEDTNVIHFLGKDNAKFHALLWPAMLKSVDLKIPTTIYVNSFLSLNGQKISKSLGNIIRPTELVEKYGTDAIRYYLLKFGPIVDDADFSENHLIEVYNGELANGIGNTLSRVFALAKKNEIDFTIPISISISLNSEFENFRPDRCIETIFEKVSEINRDINAKEVWKIEDKDKVRELILGYLNELYFITLNLKPFIPNTCEKILNSFENKFNVTNFFPRIEKENKN